jgi:hypothetical protein
MRQLEPKALFERLDRNRDLHRLISTANEAGGTDNINSFCSPLSSPE